MYDQKRGPVWCQVRDFGFKICTFILHLSARWGISSRRMRRSLFLSSCFACFFVFHFIHLLINRWKFSWIRNPDSKASSVTLTVSVTSNICHFIFMKRWNIYIISYISSYYIISRLVQSTKRKFFSLTKSCAILTWNWREKLTEIEKVELQNRTVAEKLIFLLKEAMLSLLNMSVGNYRYSELNDNS